MDLPQKIEQALIEFFSRRRTPADLREELIRLTWNVPLSGTEADRDLIGEVELCLAEYEAGHIGLEEFAARVAPRMRGLLPVSSRLNDITAGTSTTVVLQEQWTAAADIRPSLGFALVQ
jgi:hypothetical protein